MGEPMEAVIEGRQKNGLERVLIVCTDLSPGSDLLLQQAKAACVRRGASLQVVHVFDVAYSSELNAEGTSSYKSEIQARTEQLNAVVRKLHVPGFKITPILLTGNVVQRIQQLVEEVSPELVILGTAGKRGLDRWLLGSVAEAIVRSLPCPVLILGPHAKDYRNGPIVFPTDFNPSAAEDLAFAFQLSQGLRSPLYCVHFLPSKVFHKKNSAVRLIITEAFEKLAAAAGVCEGGVHFVVEPGVHLSREIVEFARRVSASAIVLSVLRRSSLLTHMPNHETFKVLATAPCPVYTLAHSKGPSISVEKMNGNEEIDHRNHSGL